MRITFGIKIIVTSVAAAMLAGGATLFLQRFTLSSFWIMFFCLLVGSIVGSVLAWETNSRVQMFSRMIHTLGEEEKKENPFSGQDEFAIWGREIVQFSQDFYRKNGERKKEMTLLAQLIEKNFGHLGQMMQNVGAQSAAVRQVLTQILEIHSIFQKVYEKIDSLASAIADTTREVDSFHETVTEEVGKVDLAFGISQEAVNAVREGTTMIHEMEEGMNKIAKHVKNGAEKIDSLRKSSEEIEEISSVIDDIADQTNLLALNASIEAARAGEQGRGFAVVAESVRNLSEKTQKATKEIVGMIKNLQEETSGAVHSMEGGTKEVETGVGMTSKAGITLKRIATSVEKWNEFMSKIKSHATEQGQIKHKISTATSEMNKGTKALLLCIEEQKQNALHLKRDVEEVDQSLFKNHQLLSEVRRDAEEITRQVAIMKGLPAKRETSPKLEAEKNEATTPEEKK